MGDATERLLNLARVDVKPHVKKVNGKLVKVKGHKRVMDLLSIGNKYFAVDEPHDVYAQIGTVPSNTYYGSSRVYSKVLKPVRAEKGDQIHDLVGGRFLVKKSGKVYELADPPPAHPFEMKYHSQDKKPVKGSEIAEGKALRPKGSYRDAAKLQSFADAVDVKKMGGSMHTDQHTWLLPKGKADALSIFDQLPDDDAPNSLDIANFEWSESTATANGERVMTGGPENNEDVVFNVYKESVGNTYRWDWQTPNYEHSTDDDADEDDIESDFITIEGSGGHPSREAAMKDAQESFAHEFYLEVGTAKVNGKELDPLKIKPGDYQEMSDEHIQGVYDAAKKMDELIEKVNKDKHIDRAIASNKERLAKIEAQAAREGWTPSLKARRDTILATIDKHKARRSKSKLDKLPTEPRRLKTITGHTAYARWLDETSEEPIGEIDRIVKLPYSYGPTHPVYLWKGKKVFSGEVGQRKYVVWEVPEGMEIRKPE